MARYFLELSYMGTHFSGFQVQPGIRTVQGELEDALSVLLKSSIRLSTSSRTDAGVHARQNFFHFDYDLDLQSKIIYSLNAIIAQDVAVRNIYKMEDTAHSRFDAHSRLYKYYIYNTKNPFLADRGWYYPFKLDIERLQQAAEVLKGYKDFTSFSKRNTQVHTFICDIKEATWTWEGNILIFTVRSNRFLRGMVRALVATMLKVGRDTITMDQLREIIESKNCANADFSAPGKGLFLEEVRYNYKLTAIV